MKSPTPGVLPLSDDLLRLISVAGPDGLTVREMVAHLHGRGLQMTVVLLCLPFLSPVAVPGLSVPFGLALALCGARIAFGHEPWLPGFILDRRVPRRALEKMLGFAAALYRRIERFVRPRLTQVFDWAGMRALIGLSIAVAGILLALPIPPPFPFTNTIPGFAVIFLAIGLLERDGLLILIGYAFTALGLLYVGLIGLLGAAGVERLWHWFSRWGGG